MAEDLVVFKPIRVYFPISAIGQVSVFDILTVPLVPKVGPKNILFLLICHKLHRCILFAFNAYTLVHEVKLQIAVFKVLLRFEVGGYRANIHLHETILSVKINAGGAGRALRVDVFLLVVAFNNLSLHTLADCTLAV